MNLLTLKAEAAEQAVLGSMLLDEKTIPMMLEQLKPDDFYISINRKLFETITGLFTPGRP